MFKYYNVTYLQYDVKNENGCPETIAFSDKTVSS